MCFDLNDSNVPSFAPRKLSLNSQKNRWASSTLAPEQSTEQSAEHSVLPVDPVALPLGGLGFTQGAFDSWPAKLVEHGYVMCCM